MAQQGRLSPTLDMTPDPFARVAPRPPSPNTQIQHPAYMGVASGNRIYSSPLAARSQPQFSSQKTDRFLETAYGPVTVRGRPGPTPSAQPSTSTHPVIHEQELLGAVQQAATSVTVAHGQQTGATSLTPTLGPGNTTHLAPGTTLSTPNATTAQADRTGSRLSLYSNYSYYGIPESPVGGSPAPTASQFPDSPQGPRSSPSNSPNASRLLRSPAPRGVSPMNPHQDAQGHFAPSQPPAASPLASSQMTPNGLYQPQYQAEQHHQRSFFKRKKSSRSTVSTRSYNPSLSDNFHGQDLPQASTPEEYLQMGITYHERDQLALSAHCFEQSATLNSGCGFGMLMWGLTLRHGWGVKRDEKVGFAWVRQAADAAVGDLEAAVNGVEADAVKVSVVQDVCCALHLPSRQNELVLAIFEVGQCYSKGWGVKEDKKLAFVRILVYSK